MSTLEKDNFFDHDYYFGGKKSNYFNYEMLNAKKLFKGPLDYIKKYELGGKILDAGCALGLFLNEAAPFFTDLYGCDISDFAVDNAKKRLPQGNFKVVNLEEEIPYPDEFFDCITALDVLDHTQKYAQVFRELLKKLKKGGHLILSMPINGWAYKLLGFLDKDKSHVSILGEKIIVDMLAASNVDIIESSKYSILPIFYRVSFLQSEIDFLIRKNH